MRVYNTLEVTNTSYLTLTKKSLIQLEMLTVHWVFLQIT